MYARNIYSQYMFHDFTSPQCSITNQHLQRTRKNSRCLFVGTFRSNGFSEIPDKITQICNIISAQGS